MLRAGLSPILRAHLVHAPTSRRPALLASACNISTARQAAHDQFALFFYEASHIRFHARTGKAGYLYLPSHPAIYTTGITAKEADDELKGALRELKLIAETSETVMQDEW